MLRGRGRGRGVSKTVETSLAATVTSGSADFSDKFQIDFSPMKNFTRKATDCHKFSFDNEILISLSRREKGAARKKTRILSIFRPRGPVAKGLARHSLANYSVTFDSSRRLNGRLSLSLSFTLRSLFQGTSLCLSALASLLTRQSERNAVGPRAICSY